MPYCTSTVPHTGARLTNYIFPMPLSHVVYLCAPPSTQAPSPPIILTLHQPLCEELWTYSMAFLMAGGLFRCPVEGCQEQSAMRMVILVNFLHLYVRDTVAILDKRNLQIPRFPRCNMMVPWRALNGTQLEISQWDRGAERKIRRLAEEELREISERIFQAYGNPF